MRSSFTRRRMNNHTFIAAQFCFTNGRIPHRTVIKVVFTAGGLAKCPSPLLSNQGNATNLSRIAIIRHAHWILIAEHLLWRDPKSDGQSRKLLRFWAVPVNCTREILVTAQQHVCVSTPCGFHVPISLARLRRCVL